MTRHDRRPRLRMFLASRPYLANRIFRALGSKRLGRLAQRSALRAAVRAYHRVPYYHARYEQAGFDAQSMRHLTWDDFQRLPIVGKADTASLPPQSMLDASIPFPEGDALVTRSSGTTGQPAMIPTGWDEFYATYAVFKGIARRLGMDRTKSIVLLAYGVDGNPAAGGIMVRLLFFLKEETHWPFEICASGEAPDAIISFLRYYAENEFETLYLMVFPGTLERVLDRIDVLTEQDPEAGVNWGQFRRKRVQLSGQVVSRELQGRISRALGIADDDLTSLEIMLGSSDTGQIVARSTPFTRWLERFIDQHPELADQLGIPVEHRTKSLMEFVPAISVLVENDPEAGLLLTTWKHWPLVRYRSNDLGWLCASHEVIKALDGASRTWRKDFARYGFRRRDVPRTSSLGMILGRIDDTVIVNGANVSPDVLRHALAMAGILPQIHHFKHSADTASANNYNVYLELPDARDTMARELLAAQWHPGLLEALMEHPAATDLQAAHRGTPITLRIFVRSRGADEFVGDDDRTKVRYTLTPMTLTLARQPDAHITAGGATRWPDDPPSATPD